MTDIDQNRLAELIIKYNDQNITPVEESELLTWQSLSSENEAFFLKYTTEPNLNKEISLRSQFASDRGWKAIISQLKATTKRGIRVKFLRYAAAATVALLITFGTRFIISHQAFKGAVSAKPAQLSSVFDMSPGSNKASLTLGNGSVIDLNAAAYGILASQGNSKIVKLADGKISYLANDASQPIEPVSNTVSTPRGGQYTVILSDGSKVWMNSASTLIYPASFSGIKRQVELIGEAYFEVTKDKSRPFFVALGNSTVEVLGTHFNIEGYPDEGFIKTTLLEGSVKVSTEGTHAIINPGQQAQVMYGNTKSYSQSKIKVLDKVNTDGIIAWKNGHFHFEKATIQAVMRELSRWYDFDVNFEPPISDLLFSGDIQRDLIFSQVMTILGDNIRYSIDGKKITVKPD